MKRQTSAQRALRAAHRLYPNDWRMRSAFFDGWTLGRDAAVRDQRKRKGKR